LAEKDPFILPQLSPPFLLALSHYSLPFGCGDEIWGALKFPSGSGQSPADKRILMYFNSELSYFAKLQLLMILLAFY